MSDLFLFLFGCVVTLFVACAVGLLLWGAATEPEDGEVPESSRSAAGSPRIGASESRQAG